MKIELTNVIGPQHTFYCEELRVEIKLSAWNEKEAKKKLQEFIQRAANAEINVEGWDK